MAEASINLVQLGETAKAIIERARGENITVRVAGSTAIHLHCRAAAERMAATGRCGKDIDLIVRGKDRHRLRSMLEADGFEVDRDLLVATEGLRFTFRRASDATTIDVFVDKMQFCHTIDLGRRLGIHAHTIPIEDLLLGKLQVHQPTVTDIADTITVLSTHEVDQGSSDPERIDSAYVAQLLAQDWGFHHTVTANLTTLATELQANGHDNQSELARAGLNRLREAIDTAPKSRGWRLRARIGERMQWWEDVDDQLESY